MCFLGWIYEILAIVAALLSALIGYQIQEFNIPNIHFPDVILMFVIIPFIHLLNDEDTKHIIFEQGWIQGIKYVLGIYTEPSPGRDSPAHRAFQNSRDRRATPQNSFSSQIPKLTSSQRRLIHRKCKSAINNVPKDVLILQKAPMHLQRKYSLKQDVFIVQSSSEHLNIEKMSSLRRSLAASSPEKLEHEIQKNTSSQSCHSSLSTIYLDT